MGLSAVKRSRLERTWPGSLKLEAKRSEEARRRTRSRSPIDLHTPASPFSRARPSRSFSRTLKPSAGLASSFQTLCSTVRGSARPSAPQLWLPGAGTRDSSIRSDAPCWRAQASTSSNKPQPHRHASVIRTGHSRQPPRCRPWRTEHRGTCPRAWRSGDQ